MNEWGLAASGWNWVGPARLLLVGAAGETATEVLAVDIRARRVVHRQRFDGEIRALRQPAVLRGLAADWPAVRAGRDGPEAAVAYLKRFSHAEPVQAIVGPPEIEGRFFYTPDLKALNFTRGRSPLDPFLDRLLRDRTAERPYAMGTAEIIPFPDMKLSKQAELATLLFIYNPKGDATRGQ